MSLIPITTLVHCSTRDSTLPCELDDFDSESEGELDADLLDLLDVIDNCGTLDVDGA